MLCGRLPTPGVQDQYGMGGGDPYAFSGASQAPSQGALGGYSSQLPRFEGLTPSQDGGASQGFRG